MDPKPVFALVDASVGVPRGLACCVRAPGLSRASGHKKAFIVQKLATRGRNHITSWA